MVKKLGKGRLVALLVVVAGALALSVGVVSAHGGGWFGGLGGDHDALLADELGITVEELDGAREAARSRAMDQALADGLITEEQYADFQVRDALQPYLDRDALVAAALGISVDDLSSQSLSAWLDELGLDRETYQANLQAAHDAAIQKAVSDGAITQEQADSLSDTMPFGGFGGFGGHRGGPGGMRAGRMQRSGDCTGTPDGSGARLRMAPVSPDQA
jgi:hypothetical protein